MQCGIYRFLMLPSVENGPFRTSVVMPAAALQLSQSGPRAGWTREPNYHSRPILAQPAKCVTPLNIGQCRLLGKLVAPKAKPINNPRRMNKHREMEQGCWSALIFERRGFLTASGITALTVGLSDPVFGQSVARVAEAILQPIGPNDEAFMQRAFEMRQSAIDYGDQAYGAIIVRDKVIIGQSWSRVILDQDPTAHAEMAAIRDAARRLNSRDLSGAVMYSSSRPCPMCEAAAFWAGVGQMIYGRDLRSAGFPKLCR